MNIAPSDAAILIGAFIGFWIQAGRWIEAPLNTPIEAAALDYRPPPPQGSGGPRYRSPGTMMTELAAEQNRRRRRR